MPSSRWNCAAAPPSKSQAWRKPPPPISGACSHSSPAVRSVWPAIRSAESSPMPWPASWWKWVTRWISSDSSTRPIPTAHEGLFRGGTVRGLLATTRRNFRWPARLVILRQRIREGIANAPPRPRRDSKSRATGPAEAYSDLRRVQVREENWRAMQAYQPARFPGRITLFKAMAASDKVELARRLRLVRACRRRA